MRWCWLVLPLLVSVVAGKGKKHRSQKPGRAVLDRLASSPGEVVVTSGAGADSGATGGLLPAPLDVAPYAIITANATCGDAGSEEFCHDTPGKRGVVCDVCEGVEGSATRRHPAPLAADPHPGTWWQSPSLAAGPEYQHVELVATLPAEMELLHVIIKSGPSPRPLAWSLDVSPTEDGDDWRIIKAFGDRELCRKLWDLRPERRRRKARGAEKKSKKGEKSNKGSKRSNRADKPSCSTQFTSPRPLENGEMHVGLGEGVSCRRVRVSMRAPHDAPPSHQYYSVRTLTLAARCRCHGHATRCTLTQQDAVCSCLHGTCGAQCERCCGGGLWAPHRACGPAEVTTCAACAERGACSSDDTGAMLCVNCTENRAGPLCDRCLFGYYSALPDGPCLPCNCDPEGSDGSCKWNRKHKRVSCKCNPGFSGPLCEVCEDPGSIFPNCQLPPTTPACKCDPRGIVDPTRVCDDICECKAHVVGGRCDTCAPGHFGLSAALPAGCRSCYCSHIADFCVSSAEPGRDMLLPLGDAWLVTDAQGNETLEPTLDGQGKPYIISYEVEGWESFYWLTTILNSDQLSAYGSEIRAAMFWGVVRGDTGGNPTTAPDAILLATDGTKLIYQNKTHKNPGELELIIPLEEGEWYTLGEDNQPGDLATRHQLMDILRDLRGIMVRAHFHMDQDEVRLDNVELRGSSAEAREVCSCPVGYAGPQCETCAWTHARVQHATSATPHFECVACPCNGHASCDAVEGVCGPCQHNTTGPHCERCLPGHYGNPVQGACAPCACPLYQPSNNFSPNCALAAADGDEYVCTQCPDGYSGDHCENCDFGYWGSPTTEGSSCQRCSCGGSPCHPDTGLCLTCPAHTEGARCDQCIEGFWFGSSNASEGVTCSSCECGPSALSVACDARSGQCACRAGWTGRACDICASGHGDVDAGCPPCRCGVGALGGACEPHSGACSCAPGAAPPACDTCLHEHYGLDHTGCKGCNCSSIGAESNACDIRTGQCRCRAHAAGRACDTCQEGYWGLSLGGCRRCACGAGAAACHPDTGACACARGVGGAHCDTCLPGYYGFGPSGCLPCPPCTDGRVCSPETGQCACPARTRGPGCRQCARGHWGRATGCRPCSCGPGALSNNCDSDTGQCQCRVGWTGTACDECSPGHFGPRCRPCNCGSAGTSRCGTDLCPCDDRGQCPCKVNVVGDKCESCRSGTFGLSLDNPAGCTECFCFGRAAHCTQAGLTRAALHAPAPVHLTLVLGTAITTMDQESLLAIHTHSPDATIALPWPPVPVYMELDKRFLGDRVTSYGGLLRFKVEEEGGEELPIETRTKFPLVRLYGKNIVLEYYERIPPINGTHMVRLHESLWRVRGHKVGDTDAVASRAALMLALQKLERIFVRVTTRAPTRNERVHALLLNVTLDTAIPGISRSEPALGVELCDCPTGYSAPSCQEPAVGFWMPPLQVHMSTVTGTIVIQLEGSAQPCHCNQRAVACDPDTGNCVNCTGGTGGPRCERCAEGYHGSPDAPGGCQPCPCPSRARNFATACALTNGRLQCLCKPGYTGEECEMCAAGWVRSGGGVCVPCGCDPRGSLGPHCDGLGRCRCREFAAGKRCDTCLATRTFLDNDGCRPCDNCTQTLLDAVEDLSTKLHLQVDVTELSRIPQPFPVVREYSANTSALRSSLQNIKQDITQARDMEKSIDDMESDEHRVFTEANRLKTVAVTKEKEADYLSLESMSSLEEVLKYRRRLGEQVAMLDDFAKGERHVSAHRALKEARRLLRNIKDINLIGYIASADDVADTANLQSTSVQEYRYRIEDALRRLEALQAALETWEAKTEDLSRRADAVWVAGDEVAAVVKRTRPRLATVRDLALRCRLIMEDITSLSEHNFTDRTAAALQRVRNLTEGFPSLTGELINLTQAAEEKEGIFYNLTPIYRKKYLQAVEKHVTELGQRAEEYKSLFAGARSAASRGVAAARAWADVSDTVRSAAERADRAVNAASGAVSIAAGPVPLGDTADNAIAASQDLATRGAAVLARAEEQRSRLDQLRRGADLVSVQLRGLGWQERDLGARPAVDVSEALAVANEQADRVLANARVLYDEAGEIRSKVRYNLRRQLAELHRNGDTALGAVQEHVSQIGGNTERNAETAAALSAAAAARAREHAVGAAVLDPALAALRDKVARARHAADSISVSVTSASVTAAGCSRAYAAPTAASPAMTRAALAVSFDGAVRDGPLLSLIGDAQKSKSYMKLFVNKNRLHLKWNLGSDEALIVHPEELQPAHDDADHTTYRVDIERVWNSVSLRVERAGGAAVTANNASGAAAVSLRPAQLWLGAPDDATGLPGCVHALYYDDRRVGLWNFLRQPKGTKCTGCTQRWVNSARGNEPSLAWFNGAGYAELRRSGLRPSDRRQFSLAFTFRTRDEDALLFMAVDTANNRSVLVRMRSCLVQFEVQYSDALLRITARGRHCHGRPVHVQAIRVFAGNKLEKGSLRVNGEETLGSPSPPVQTAAELPDLSAATYWVGGTPPGREAPHPPLLGCLGALTVDREGYNLLDTPTRHGVEPKCGARTLRSAMLKGAGYIELPSPSLRRKGALGLSFRALAPRGLLLYRTPLAGNEVDDEDGDDKHYLMLAMVDGELEVRAAAGKSELRLRSNGTRLDDGRLHTARIVRAHKQVELWVDERLAARGALAGNAYKTRSGGLYLGGVPDVKDFTLEGDPPTAFTGTIADYIVDSTLIGLENAIRWSGARLGRAHVEPLAEPRTEPRALHAQPDLTAECTKRSSYTVEGGAAKFGDVPWSYATLRAAGRTKELALTMHFRTFATNGLLLLVPGSKAKPKHYVALVVREGRLKLIVRGRKRREVALPDRVDDGTWRSVSVRVGRSRSVVALGGTAATLHAPAPARPPRLYIGGMPEPDTLPNIPNAIVKLGGFVGCVRGVTLGGRAQDLARDAASHRGLAQCFPHVEPAAYFSGDAYATWSTTWLWGGTVEGMEVRLQFRTADPSGVLLSAGPLLLEIKDGAVMVTHRSSVSGVSAVRSRGAGGRALCDDRWHAVSARAWRSHVTLTLDAGPELRGDSPTLLQDAADSPATPVPLYVGGLPEGLVDFPDGGKENFKGCIRDVTVAGQKRDWTSMDSLHNVLLDSCPVPQ